MIGGISKQVTAPQGRNDFEGCLAEAKPEIGNYAWLWRILKARARQTGFPPRKLYPLLKRFCNPKRPYFIGETLEGIAFLGDYLDRYSIDRMVCPHFDKGLVTFLVERLRTTEGAYLDVGANMGIIAAAVAKALPATPVLAFEPMPETGHRAMATFALNELENVQFLPLAIGDTNTLLTFYDAPGHSDMASANPAEMSIPIDWTPTRVSCRTLDSLREQNLLPKVGLMKLDVEGHEYKALQGSAQLIATDRPHILFEYNREIAPQMNWSPEDAIELISSYSSYRFHVLEEDGSLLPLSFSDKSFGFDNLYAEPC